MMFLKKHNGYTKKLQIKRIFKNIKTFRGKNKLYALGYMLAECSLGLNLAIQWALTCSFLGVARYGQVINPR